MKISFLEDKLPINGSIRHIIEMANELVGRNHDVTIYANDTHCAWLQCGAKILPQRKVIAGSHDILIFNLATKAQWHLMEQSRAKHKVFYLMGMGDGDRGRDNVRRWLTQPSKGYNNTLKRCLQRSDYTVVCNGAWMHDFLAELGFKSHIALSAIDTDMFYPVSNKRTIRPSVMISGDPRARYETLNIHRSLNRVRQTIDVDMLQYFGKGIPQFEMAAYISQGWVFVDAQNRAGWNNPVAEAMACGVPVVCTDIGGNKDFAEHGETALIVPVGDIEAMSQAILELIQNRDKAERLAANALEVMKTHTWSRSTDQLLEALA